MMRTERSASLVGLLPVGFEFGVSVFGWMFGTTIGRSSGGRGCILLTVTVGVGEAFFVKRESNHGELRRAACTRPHTIISPMMISPITAEISEGRRAARGGRGGCTEVAIE